jgi:hypothetical protein
MECDAVGTFSRRPCILTVAMKARLARSSEHADEPQSLIIRLACPDGYMATLRAGVPRIFDRIGPRLPAVGNGQLSATTGAQKLGSCRSLRLMDFMCLSGAVVEVLVLEPDCCRKGLGTRLLTHARSLRGPLSVDENEQIESLCTSIARMDFQHLLPSETDWDEYTPQHTRPTPTPRRSRSAPMDTGSPLRCCRCGCCPRHTC